MTIYLYLKTHNVTGMKYLGKTIRNDVDAYQGSGKVWKRHIKKHGYYVSTEILFESSDKELFNKVAKGYSDKLNIVESKNFANLCPEEGQGGRTEYSEERNRKISESHKGKSKPWAKELGKKNKGFVSAIEISTGSTIRVTSEEFHNNPHPAFVDDVCGIDHDPNRSNRGNGCKNKSNFRHLQSFHNLLKCK